MDFNTLLQSLPTGTPAVAQTKVASVDTSKQQLASAVEATKTASASSQPANADAIGVLLKQAEIMATNEKTAEELHSHMCGRSFALGALEVFSAADAAAQKVAAEMGPNEKEVAGDIKELKKDLAKDEKAHEKKEKASEKEEDDEEEGEDKEAGVKTAAERFMVKAAAEQGYRETMEKAAADYEQGQEAAYNDAVKVAADEFIKGSLEARVLIERARNQ